MAALRFTVLGPVRAWRDGEELDLVLVEGWQQVLGGLGYGHGGVPSLAGTVALRK